MCDRRTFVITDTTPDQLPIWNLKAEDELECIFRSGFYTVREIHRRYLAFTCLLKYTVAMIRHCLMTIQTLLFTPLPHSLQ